MSAPPRAGRVWATLALRPASSLALLLLTAGLYAARGGGDPFGRAAAWWLWFATGANVLSILTLAGGAREEGLRLRDLYNARRSTWRGDLAWALGSLLASSVLAMAPGAALATLLWGGSDIPNGMLFGPLPLPAVYPLFLLFPLGIALAELPLYWGYVAPRLRALGMGRAATILLVGAVLSVQHLCFSFQPDWRYALWLALKFLPFALWTGFVVARRPTVLPYLMASHFLMDASLPWFALRVARGLPL